MMGARETLLNPVVTLRRVMDFYDQQDIDLLCDLNDENGFVDLMLGSQTTHELRELVAYLDPLLADPSVSEQDFLDLLQRCRGGAFEDTAHQSVTKLAARAHDFIDGKVYRPTRSD
jgi:hypothetical protein